MVEKSKTTLVSICCVTYNHENFIKDCIEGFIKQKTDFDYEILIHDDASTDYTTGIVREYEKKYPKLIKVIYQTENQFLKQNVLFNILFPMAKGKYIALCEGDDYWTDPYKLQKQVDIIENNELCNYVFTNHSILDVSGNISESNFKLNKIFNLHYLLEKQIIPPTLTLMFEKKAIINNKQWKELMTKTFNGDWVLLFMLAQDSKMSLLNDNTAVYRRGIGIISKTNMISQLKNGLKTSKALDKYTHYKYHYYFKRRYINYGKLATEYSGNKKYLNAIYFLLKRVCNSLINKEKYFFKNNLKTIKSIIIKLR